jgi:hypothetical protein
MIKKLYNIFTAAFLLLLFGCKDTSVQPNTDVDTFTLEKFEAVAVPKSNTSTQLYVHYMPWFFTKDNDGFWGSHWTMNTQNPDVVDENGKRQIAAHFYPLIGPYSSKDPAAVEYHLLLMKLSGIDAVMIDWYGTYDVYDYKDNFEGANALINKIEEVGLKFAIVYEDRSVEAVVNNNLASTAIEAAKNDFNYIQSAYFSKSSYLYVDEKPLAMVFTPVFIENGSAWSQIFEDLSPKPHLLSLWEQKNDLGAVGTGEYSWVYNGNNNHATLLQNFYNRINRLELGIGSAYPGFNDFYEEGGYGNIIGWDIPHNDTQTLKQTLDLAKTNTVKHLQLVTWNDFGEGTMIEPTEEFGYAMLEEVQAFSGVSYSADDLALVKELYTKRKLYASEQQIQLKLDQVFYYIVSLQIEEAKNLLQELSELN